MAVKLDMLPGALHSTNNSGILEVVEYFSSLKVRVRFLDTGFETTTGAGDIRKGKVKDKLIPSVFGVGFLGEGKYTSSETGKKTPAYQTWKNMIQRCYSEAYQSIHPTYKGCVVCAEWRNFQNFASWWHANYVTGYDLDKDILGNGKLYSPHTCKFVSHSDNIKARTNKLN